MGLVLPKYADGCILRNFMEGDAESLADIEYDPEVKKYLALPDRPRSEWIRSFSPNLMRGWAVEANPEHILAGRASISKTSVPGEGELEIVIGKSFRGRHLGRKVVAILIPAAFQELRAVAVIAVVHPKNQACLRLLESWGFIYRDEKQSDNWQNGHLIFELGRSTYNSSFK